jgi:hypothetical protein
VKPLLQQVDGVAGVEVNGGRARDSEFDRAGSKRWSCPFPPSARLAAANLDVPGGTVTAGGKDGCFARRRVHHHR